MKEIRKKEFANGSVYALETHDGYPVEVTDTFLPFYTKDAIGRRQNALNTHDLGSRAERWMIGVSVMSGCPVGCRFCATGQLPRWRRLGAGEIIDQIRFVLERRDERFEDAKEYKINYTRMGEPFLNTEQVKLAVLWADLATPGVHQYISTIGIEGSDFSWIRNDATLQISLHSCDEKKRDWLIPYKRKMSIADLGKIRTESNLKTTLNLTLVDEQDFDIRILKDHFPKEEFFVKLSPINRNAISDSHGLGGGAIRTANLI